jgi:hypothetical protein
MPEGITHESLDKAGGPLMGGGRKGMFHGRFQESFVFQPRTRPKMEIPYEAWLFCLQMSVEKVTEQVMVTIPMSIIVKGNEKQVVSFQSP